MARFFIQRKARARSIVELRAMTSVPIVCRAIECVSIVRRAITRIIMTFYNTSVPLFLRPSNKLGSWNVAVCFQEYVRVRFSIIIMIRMYVIIIFIPHHYDRFRLL